MKKYLVAIHHPDDFDGSTETEGTRRDISALNEEMVAKGARVFVGGLQSAGQAKSMRAQADGEVVVSDGPYLPGREHVGGLWVLECPDMDEAVEWGRKAAVACRAPVEVREFH